jgi:hypothetical protein
MSVWEIVLLGFAAIVSLGFLSLAGLTCWSLLSIARQEEKHAAKMRAAWNPETKAFDGLEFRDSEWREVTE